LLQTAVGQQYADDARVSSIASELLCVEEAAVWRELHRPDVVSVPVPNHHLRVDTERVDRTCRASVRGCIVASTRDCQHGGYRDDKEQEREPVSAGHRHRI